MMQGLYNLIGGIRDVIHRENAMNLMDYKEINEIVQPEADTTRSLINRLHKSQATFFGHLMRRETEECLVTSGMIEGK